MDASCLDADQTNFPATVEMLSKIRHAVLKEGWCVLTGEGGLLVDRHADEIRFRRPNALAQP